MNIIFLDKDLEMLYVDGFVKKGTYKSLSRDKKLVEGFQRAVTIMYAVESTDDLKKFSNLHYEKLKNRPESSVRIVNGKVERLLFTETADGVEVSLIELNSKHYGKKR